MKKKGFPPSLLKIVILTESPPTFKAHGSWVICYNSVQSFYFGIILYFSSSFVHFVGQWHYSILVIHFSCIYFY